jgi:uncharacterized protein YbjQ (UPF0145 family)
MILDKAIPSREVGGTYVSGSHFLPDWRVKRGEVQSITDEIKKARDAALQELSEMKLDGKIRSNYYSTTKKDDS